MDMDKWTRLRAQECADVYDADSFMKCRMASISSHRQNFLNIDGAFLELMKSFEDPTGSTYTMAHEDATFVET